MPTAIAQQYGNGFSLNISSMTNDAPNLRDLSVDDTTTFYQSNGLGNHGICSYWDLGSSQPVDQVRCTIQMTGNSTNTSSLDSSPDGTTWTARQTISTSLLSSLTSFNFSFTSVSARYWRLRVAATVVDNTGDNSSTMISDYRLYTGGSQYTIGSSLPQYLFMSFFE